MGDVASERGRRRREVRRRAGLAGVVAGVALTAVSTQAATSPALEALPLTVVTSVGGGDQVLAALAATPPAPAPVVPVAPVVEAPAAPAEAPAPAPAPAAVPVVPVQAAVAAVPHHLEVGRQAVEAFTFIDVSAYGWRVDLLPGRPGMLGLTDWSRKVIEIYIRDGHTVTDVLGTLAHEATHVLDWTVLTDADRDAWTQLRGLEGPWWPSCTCNDRAFGAGDLAEAVVALVAGPGEYTGYPPLPNAEQLNWLRTALPR